MIEKRYMYSHKQDRTLPGCNIMYRYQERCVGILIAQNLKYKDARYERLTVLQTYVTKQIMSA